MSALYTLSLLVIGVIGTNIIKQFIPKIPEAFILIVVGVLLSFTRIFNHFELEPEFFMLAVIAPLMFLDGQQQSFKKIRQRFSIILLLSVVLAVASAAAVGVLANWLESSWSLPLAIALAAIVVPTDAVAVKSLTSDTQMPEGVNEALELESLFNDATGLVMLDLALSVLQKGAFSLTTGLMHFLFVAIGGVIIGILSGFILVWLRSSIAFRMTQPETTIIPISLLTPFAVYFMAETWHTSGILAVVATGIVHNWESSKLKLTSTNVQLTQTTVWQTFSNILNSIVFLILGISLPTVFHEIARIGLNVTIQLIGLASLIYLTMFIVRFIWARYEDNKSSEHFFGPRHAPQHNFYSRVFAISGVHGTVTLAMAFSLPTHIGHQPFPYREQLIIVATAVILISMIISAIALPLMLPAQVTSYTPDELNQTRNDMVDFATLQMRRIISDHDQREIVTAQLQSQKGWHQITDRETIKNNYQSLLTDTQNFISDYLHSDQVTTHYQVEVINAYQKIITRFDANHQRLSLGRMRLLKRITHRLAKSLKHTTWHLGHWQFTKKQKQLARQKWLTQHADKQLQWADMKSGLLALNDEVINAVDHYLDDVLANNIANNHTENQHIDFVRRDLDRYFTLIRRDYSKNTPVIASTVYIEAFQAEYNFIQDQVKQGKIPATMASLLYTEINQAQTLQLQQAEQIEGLGDQ
ncbi:sodium:proton antiporter [Leuconostoc citreum]